MTLGCELQLEFVAVLGTEPMPVEEPPSAVLASRCWH